MQSRHYLLCIATTVLGICTLTASSSPFDRDSPSSLTESDHKGSAPASPFVFSDLVISPSMLQVDQLVNVNVSFKITNTGNRDGDAIAEMYTSWMNATASRPISKLDGFERYSVKKGTSVSGSMTISSKQLQLNDAVKGWTVEPGTITIFVGGQQPNQHNLGGSNIINETLLLYDGHRNSAGTSDCLTFHLIFCIVTFYICSYMAK